MRKVAIFLVIILQIGCAFGASDPSKPPPLPKKYNLSVLHMVSISGQLLFRGEACMAASQLVADLINARSDILPDYHVEMRFEDDAVGVKAAQQLANYDRSFSKNSTLLKAPIVIGPMYSTGCKAMGPMLPSTHSVAISTYCTAPFLADHWRFPNLYLIMGTHRTTMFAFLKFIREVGQWNRFGIISNVGNINDYGSALFLNENALKMGLVIPWFDMVSDVDETTIKSLMQNDVRVLAIAMAHDLLMIKTLCETYKQGFTGPRYAFIADIYTLTNPLELPDEIYPGCKKTMVFEQLKITYQIGVSMYPTDEVRNRKSFLGYTWPEFEKMIDKRIVNQSDPTWRPGDYMTRYQCHDGTLKTLISLDIAERNLNAINLSLRDWRENGDQLMKFANESVAHDKIPGLRTGNVSYNSRGLIENEVENVALWSPQNGHETIVTIQQLPNTIDFQYESYEVRLSDKMKTWIPPNDQPRLVEIRRKVSQGVFIAVLVLAILAAVYQIGCIIVSIKMRCTFWSSKMTGYFGCLLMDIAAILFATPHFGQGISTARVVLLVLGTSITHAVLAMRSIVAVGKTKITPLQKSASGNCINGNARPSSTLQRTKHTRHPLTTSSSKNRTPTAIGERRDSPSNPLEYEQYMPKDDRSTVAACIPLLLAIVAVLICWFVIDPMKCADVMAVEPFYIETTDTIVETWLFNCASRDWMIAWVVVILIVHVLQFLFATFAAYQLGQKYPGYPELTFIRGGIANAATMLVGAFLVVIILDNPISQYKAIAFSTLLSSTVTSFTWIYPTSRERSLQ